jgi:hypothetical protein
VVDPDHAGRGLIRKANIKLDPAEEDWNKPDSRKITTEFPATLPLVCEVEGKGTNVVGSANYVEGNRAVTVLHTIVDTVNNCDPIVKLDTCSLFDGKRQYFLKWQGDPVSMCRYLTGGSGSDAIVVGSLTKKIPGRKPYKIACMKTVPQEADIPVLVVGANATNWKGRKIRYGKERLLSPGHTYGVRISGAGVSLKYSNDTGKLTSGGAVLMKIGSRQLLVALNRGDHLGGSQNAQYIEDQFAKEFPDDGMLADPFDNFSDGLMFGPEVGCE